MQNEAIFSLFPPLSVDTRYFRLPTLSHVSLFLLTFLDYFPLSVHTTHFRLPRLSHGSFLGKVFSFFRPLAHTTYCRLPFMSSMISSTIILSRSTRITTARIHVPSSRHAATSCPRWMLLVSVDDGAPQKAGTLGVDRKRHKA